MRRKKITKTIKRKSRRFFVPFSLDETESLRPRPHWDEGRRAREKEI